MKDHVGEELVHVDDGDEEAEYVDDKMTSGGQVCRLSYLVLVQVRRGVDGASASEREGRRQGQGLRRRQGRHYRSLQEH